MNLFYRSLLSLATCFILIGVSIHSVSAYCPAVYENPKGNDVSTLSPPSGVYYLPEDGTGLTFSYTSQLHSSGLSEAPASGIKLSLYTEFGTRIGYTNSSGTNPITYTHTFTTPGKYYFIKNLMYTAGSVCTANFQPDSFRPVCSVTDPTTGGNSSNVSPPLNPLNLVDYSACVCLTSTGSTQCVNTLDSISLGSAEQYIEIFDQFVIPSLPPLPTWSPPACTPDDGSCTSNTSCCSNSCSGVVSTPSMRFYLGKHCGDYRWDNCEIEDSFGNIRFKSYSGVCNLAYGSGGSTSHANNFRCSATDPGDPTGEIYGLGGVYWWTCEEDGGGWSGGDPSLEPCMMVPSHAGSIVRCPTRYCSPTWNGGQFVDVIVTDYKTSAGVCAAPATGASPTVTPPPGTSTPTPTVPPPACPALPEVINRRTKWLSDYSQINISWHRLSGTVTDYEIWNIGDYPLNPANPSAYYLQKINTSVIPPSVENFTTTNIASLPTRRFLIKAISTRDSGGNPVCYDQWELCSNAVLSDVSVVNTGGQVFSFSWNSIVPPFAEYEIWLKDMTVIPPEYIQIADGIPKTATSYTLAIPAGYQNETGYRFLVRAINTQNTNSLGCYDQWELEFVFDPEVPPAVGPFWQVLSGLVYAKNQVVSNVPALKFLLNQFPSSVNIVDSAGIPLVGSSFSSPNPGAGILNQRTFPQDSSYVPSHPEILCTTYSYEYFQQKLKTSAISNPNQTGSYNNLNLTWNPAPSVDATSVAYVTGDLNLNLNQASVISAGEKKIIIVDGDVTITSSAVSGIERLIQVEKGGFFAIIAQGTITIENNVGYATPQASPTQGNLEGMYLAYQTLNIQSVLSPTIPEYQFVGAGSFIGCGASQGIALNRSSDSDPSSSNKPTEVFLYRPDFLDSVPSVLKEVTVHWQEKP